MSDLQDANKKLEDDIEREKKLEQARTDFFSAVSHELKTPIKVIKGKLEGMLLGIGTYKDHGKYLARSLEVANTLEAMVQEILTISRLDAGDADFKKDTFDCVQVIQRYLSETEDLMAEKDLQICFDLLAFVFINGNRMLMEKVFFNLIGNAVKYSLSGAAVQISGHREGNGSFPLKTREHIYRMKVFQNCLMLFTAWNSQGAGKQEGVGWGCMSHKGY